MLLPQSPAEASEINRGCDPRRTRPLTRLSPAPRRGAGHPSRLVSSPPAFSRAPAGRRGEEGYAHQPGVTPPVNIHCPFGAMAPWTEGFPGFHPGYDLNSAFCCPYFSAAITVIDSIAGERVRI